MWDGEMPLPEPVKPSSGILHSVLSLLCLVGLAVAVSGWATGALLPPGPEQMTIEQVGRRLGTYADLLQLRELEEPPPDTRWTSAEERVRSWRQAWQAACQLRTICLLTCPPERSCDCDAYFYQPEERVRENRMDRIAGLEGEERQRALDEALLAALGEPRRDPAHIVELLELGANGIEVTGETGLLCQAARRAEGEVVAALLAQGAEADMHCGHGNTPLSLAV